MVSGLVQCFDHPIGVNNSGSGSPISLALDNTYKTKHFKMPLLNFTGTTNVGSTFNVGFALVTREDEEAYNLAMSAFDKVCDFKGIRNPQAIITNFEIPLKNALGNIWYDIN